LEAEAGGVEDGDEAQLVLVDLVLEGEEVVNVPELDRDLVEQAGGGRVVQERGWEAGFVGESVVNERLLLEKRYQAGKGAGGGAGFLDEGLFVGDATRTR